MDDHKILFSLIIQIFAYIRNYTFLKFRKYKIRKTFWGVCGYATQIDGLGHTF